MQHWQEMFKEIVKWKVETDQNLKVILSSWKSMQVLECFSVEQNGVLCV